MNEYEEAAKTLLEYVSLTPESQAAPAYMMDAARIYERSNELEKAATPLIEAAKNPANADAAGKLIDLAAKLENARQPQ